MTHKKIAEQPFLRIVVDNSHRVRIVQAPDDAPPFSIQADAVEEDTALVLSADSNRIYDSNEHPIHLMTALYEEPARVPGSVTVQGTRPYHFLAIVHDFNQQISFRKEWVWSALDEIFLQCESRKISALKLAPIGIRHGTLTLPEFRQHLDSLFDHNVGSSLKHIWLVTP